MVLAALVAGGCGRFSDDFNRHNVNPARWTFVNPLGDATVAMTGAGTGDAAVRLTVPGGTSHNPVVPNRSARIMRPTPDADVVATVKFDSTPTQRFQMQGLTVEDSATRWLRFEVFHDGTKLHAYAAAVNTAILPLVDEEIPPSHARYLRVTRAGNLWTFATSANGTAWDTRGSFTTTIKLTALGPHAGNFGFNGPAPAFTAVVDWVLDAADPFDAEDGEPVPGDVLAPFVHVVGAAPHTTALGVSWATDEPSSGSVQYGRTTGYELGRVVHPAVTHGHSVTLTGLDPATTYHYRITANDGRGNIVTTGDLVATTLHQVGGPVIEVWYGDVQGFGQAGRSQVWVNVLGRVSDPQGVASLVYRLNGGAPRALSLGPNNRRLALPGDFNADILYSELVAGANSVVLTATDGVGQVSVRSVTVQYTPGVSLPGPLTVDWSQAGSIGDVAQVVDGEWVLSGGGVRPTVLDYDRTISVGDVGWTDYEVSFPVTVHALDPGGYASPSNGPAVGMMLRWSGHSASGAQPAQGYWPAGALAYYRWHPDGRERYYLIGNQNSPSDLDLSTGLVLGTPYVFKAQVTSEGDGYHYRYKAWPQGQAEPVGWSMEIVETSPGADAGALLLIAHHVDATFGTVTVTPL